jgi:hypothetical protein
MGGHPYWYFAPYETDPSTALQKLRRREFEAGRYNPAVPFPTFPVDLGAASPGAKHRSIEAALEDSDADGTRSILDVERIGKRPGAQIAVLLDAVTLKRYFGTAEPNHGLIEECEELFEDIRRGEAVCFAVYKDGQPDEWFFAGYSFD